MPFEVIFTTTATRSRHTGYSLVVVSKGNGSRSLVLKRYSEMLSMHNKLATLKKTLPAFPPKKLFGNLKPEFVRKRLIDSQNYFRKVVKVGEVCQSRVFKDFISSGK